MSQTVSIIITCYYAQDFICKTVREVISQFEKNNKYDYQIILVDDGSKDNTYVEISRLSEMFPNVIGIQLSQNFGQNKARMAALPYANGDYAIFMDDDGQHSASSIFKLIDKIDEGNDLVYAKFPTLKESYFRRFLSRSADLAMSALTKKPKNIRITSFFALSSFALKNLKNFKSPYIFIGGYLFEITDKITSVSIEHLPRKQGTSGYNLKKLYNLMLENMLAFPHVLGNIIRSVGYLTMSIAVILAAVSIYYNSQFGFLSALIIFFFSINTVILGIISEITVRAYCKSQGLPNYVVRNIVGFKQKKS